MECGHVIEEGEWKREEDDEGIEERKVEDEKEERTRAVRC
jgi:hypothetical protein